MKLPDGEHAIVEIFKLTEYCLNSSHFRGQHKAKVFASALGLSADDAELLREALLDAAKSLDAVPGESDAYGQRFVVDFTMQGRTGSAFVRSTWIIKMGESAPRLTSCYVL